MSNNLEFIIQNFIKISKTNRTEKMSDILSENKQIEIKGTKKGFLKNEEIQILISSSSSNLGKVFTIKVINNNKELTEEVKSDIIYDVCKNTNMLDDKLIWKLDVILYNKKVKFENNQLIII